MAVDVPDWCEWRGGANPLLLVAPHGGRRPPVDAALPPPRLRVNDLFTPEVTRTLAARLAAAVVINHAQDRNTLDLNRVSEVRHRAPWFLELLVEQIGAIIARHGHAEVVFIHGWNITQPKCDIGIGATETDGGLQLAPGARLTVSERYARGRVAALQTACTEMGIVARIGEKYPAAHRNNILQLFAPREIAVDDTVLGRLVDWSREGRVNALQLELGIPLRWPGSWREKFIAAFVGTFGAGDASGVDDVTPCSIVPGGGSDGAPSGSRSAALQFYDPEADMGLLAAVGRSGPRSTSGRLLLFLGGQRVALFTGEDASLQGTCVAPLEFAAEETRLHLRFFGPMLLLDDGAGYLDLEAALGASQLAEADVDLVFTSLQHMPLDVAPRFGSVTGQIRIGDRKRSVRTGGFSNAAGFRATGLVRQTMIAASFGVGRGLLARADETRTASLAFGFGDGHIEALSGARITVSADGDVYTPGMLELVCHGQLPLRGRPLSRMAILRPAGTNRYLRVTFGVAEYRWGDLAGYGLYEHARPVEQ